MAASAGGGAAVPTIVGGEGTGELNDSGGRSARIVGSVLAVDGVLYATSPDNAWAIDARDGRLLWKYVWKTRGGTHTGNRGFGMKGNYLFMTTPDNYLISLDARTGAERWHVKVAELAQQYFTTMAPIVIGNHVLVSPGNDLDAPAYLQAFDPETGAQQWRWYATPQNEGDAGLETLEEPRRRPPRRRPHVDPRFVRPGHEALYRRYRESNSLLYLADPG